MARCASCVLPEEVAPLSKDGVCSLCERDDGRVRYRGEDALVRTLERHRRAAQQRGLGYDCLVAASGGKDSTYALYMLVRKYGMRPLAFYYEHSFADAQSKSNLESAIGKLGVDLVRNRDDRLQREYLRHNLRQLARFPRDRRLGRLYSLLCVACGDGYGGKAMEIARKNGISLIIQGGCPVEPELRTFVAPRPGASFKKEFLKLAGREVLEVVRLPIFHTMRYRKNISTHMLACRALCGSLLGRLKKPKPTDVDKVQFFGFVEWDEKEILDTLRRELGWRQPAGRTSVTRFDCVIHVLRDTLCKKYLGINDKENMYSMMVRKKMVTRDEAVRRMEAEMTEENLLLAQTLRDVLDAVEAPELWGELRDVWDL